MNDLEWDGIRGQFCFAAGKCIRVEDVGDEQCGFGRRERSRLERRHGRTNPGKEIGEGLALPIIEKVIASERGILPHAFQSSAMALDA